MNIFGTKTRCDGCGVKVKEDVQTIVKFKATDETGHVYESQLTLCENCAINLEQVVQDAIDRGEGIEE